MKKTAHTATAVKITKVPAIIIGILVASVFSTLLTVLLTSLVMKGTVGEGNTAPYIFLVRAAATASGCLAGMVLLQEKYLVIASGVSAGYLIVLAGLGIVLYDGSFQNVLSAAISILLGGTIACVVMLRPLKKPKHTARYRR